jgi:hypothetical protein
VSELRVVAERAINAPAKLVYRLIADFDRRHPRFLPPAFSESGSRRTAGCWHNFKLTARCRRLGRRPRPSDVRPHPALARLRVRTRSWLAQHPRGIQRLAVAAGEAGLIT